MPNRGVKPIVLVNGLASCYDYGKVGGLVADNQGTVSDSFWDTQTSGQSTSAGGTGKTTTQMQDPSTFVLAGWDFIGETVNGIEDIWFILQGDYPRLWKPAGLM